MYGTDGGAMRGRCRAYFTGPIVYGTDDAVPCTVDEANCVRGGGSTADLKNKNSVLTPQKSVLKLQKWAPRLQNLVMTPQS